MTQFLKCRRWQVGDMVALYAKLPREGTIAVNPPLEIVFFYYLNDYELFTHFFGFNLPFSLFI